MVGDEDWAGASVQMSADGERLAAFVENEEGEDVVQAYQLIDNVWEPIGNTISGDHNFRLQGRMVMSADGETLALNGTINSTFWRFKVYRFVDGQWQQQGSTISSSEDDDLFAWSMSLSADGNRMAVGAPKANNNGADSGNVTIWDFSEGDWVQVGSTISGESIRDETGFSVSLSDDGQRLAVGDHYYDEPDFNSGRMRVFEWVENDWQQIGDASIGEDRADFYGHAVVISPDGSTVAAGAPQAGGNNGTAGQVRVFGEHPWENITNVEEPNNQFNLFPNPTQGLLYVDAPVNTSWRIFDVYGRELASGQMMNGQLDLQQLKAGAYLIHLDIGESRTSRIIIKQ